MVYTDYPWYMALMPIFELPAFVFYVVFMIVLVKNRKGELSSSFFQLVTSLGINDIGYAIFWHGFGTFFYRDDGIAQSPSARKLVMTFSYWLYGAFPCSQLAAVILMAVNRFTALLLPTKHKKLWSGSWQVPTAILLHWSPFLFVGGAVFTLPMFEMYKIHPNESDPNPLGYELYFISRFVYWFLMMLYEIVMATTVVVLYTLMAVNMFIYRRRRKVRSTQERKEWAREVKLALIGFILGMCVVCLALMHILIGLNILALGNRTVASFMFYVGWPVMTAFFTQINPILILACSTPARDCFKKLFGWQ